MKTVYLVRHGQTISNKNVTFQGPDDMLTEEGILQAQRLAERVSHLQFEKMIVSDFERAKQTASEITKLIDVPLEYSSLFREEKRPSSWVGKNEKSEEGKQYETDLVENAHDKNWRVEDAENAHDVFERVVNALKYLEDDPAETMLVVSHGTFLKQLIGHIILDQNGSVAEMANMRRTLKTTNTGISVIYYDRDRWRLLCWNDHSHFAE